MLISSFSILNSSPLCGGVSAPLDLAGYKGEFFPTLWGCLFVVQFGDKHTIILPHSVGVSPIAGDSIKITTDSPPLCRGVSMNDRPYFLGLLFFPTLWGCLCLLHNALKCQTILPHSVGVSPQDLGGFAITAHSSPLRRGFICHRKESAYKC